MGQDDISRVVPKHFAVKKKKKKQKKENKNQKKKNRKKKTFRNEKNLFLKEQKKKRLVLAGFFFLFRSLACQMCRLMLLVGNSRGGGTFEVTGADAQSTWSIRVSDLRGKSVSTLQTKKCACRKVICPSWAAILASVPGQAGVT